MREPSENQVERLALLLSAAHWRGVLLHLHLEKHHKHVHDAMVRAAAEADAKSFTTRATLALEGLK